MCNHALADNALPIDNSVHPTVTEPDVHVISYPDIRSAYPFHHEISAVLYFNTCNVSRDRYILFLLLLSCPLSSFFATPFTHHSFQTPRYQERERYIYIYLFLYDEMIKRTESQLTYITKRY